MCEHREQLQKAAFELNVMIGNQTINLARLKQLLNQPCEHDKQG